MLEVKNIKFKYKRSEELVLKDISFDIEKGDCLCILGPNGTGKTTLLKIILSFFKPMNGSIYVDNQDLLKLSSRQRAKYIAYVSQSSNIVFPYTVLEVILMGRTPHLNIGASMSTEDKEIAVNIMDDLGISHMKNRYFQNLSGGERQMVMIARALAQQSKYLIMDEPTAALDYSNQIKILDTINKLSKSGYGIIMTSHFPDHAFISCNKAILMKDGYIINSGNPEEVVNSESLTKLYDAHVGVTEAKISDEMYTYFSKVCVPVFDNNIKYKEN